MQQNSDQHWPGNTRADPEELKSRYQVHSVVVDGQEFFGAEAYESVPVKLRP